MSPHKKSLEGNVVNRFAGIAARALFVALSGIGAAAAADYPTHPIKWVVPYPPGGTTDVLARIVASWLGDKLGQPVVIENKPGGGNNIGVDFVVKSAPDGYTMLLVNPANGINATLYKNLTYDFIRDIAPVAGLVRAPNVMEVTLSLPVHTVGDTVPGYEATAWFGIGMPKGTPRDVIDKVNAETNRALSDPKMLERLAELGGKPIKGTPEDFGKVIAAETAKWAKVVAFSGAKAE